MTKQKKKRNKPYRGSGAAASRPTITHVSAVKRSKLGQWRYDNKRILRATGIALLVVLVLILIVTGIVGLFR